jgi:hypothetical protein
MTQAKRVGAMLAALAWLLCLGATAEAQLPKEGAFKGTYYTFGTVKATPVGKERLLLVFDENGLTLSDGFLDHLTWHCWGSADFANGVGALSGTCVGTNPAGDQMSGDFVHEKWPALDAKNARASAKFTAGTGKFAGVSGGFTYVAHVNELRTAVEGTYAAYADLQGSYKLP